MRSRLFGWFNSGLLIIIIVKKKIYSLISNNLFKKNITHIYNPCLKIKPKKIIFNFFKKDELKIINIGRLTDQKDQITLLKFTTIYQAIIEEANLSTIKNIAEKTEGKGPEINMRKMRARSKSRGG
jgi:hypothetical protein